MDAAGDVRLDFRLGHTAAIALVLACLASAAAAAEGDPKKGKEIAIKHCSRCHVVGDYNRYGGIESTPSFRRMVRYPKIFMERFATFYDRRPHPAFVRVEGVRSRFKLPPYAAPFTISLDDVEHILAFVKTLDGKARPQRRPRRR
jgi:hypothetical protein